MTDAKKPARLTATDLVKKDRKLRELRRAVLAEIAGGGEAPGLKYRYKY
jgi:hypothetical protein